VDVLPFFRLKSLRSLYTLSANRWEAYDNVTNFAALVYEPYDQSSNITTLVLDQCSLPPTDAVRVLNIPKALESLRWCQEVSCYSIGTCVGPFHRAIGKALQVHKNTLVDLDLDIRHRYCKELGHRSNPNGKPEHLIGHYRNDHIPKCAFRGPQDDILIGSFAEFKVLKRLAIDATALCGHDKWAP